MTYPKINSTPFFSTNIFSKMNTEKVTKRRGPGALLKFFEEVSIVVLTDLIAILLTPGIFRK